MGDGGGEMGVGRWQMGFPPNSQLPASDIAGRAGAADLGRRNGITSRKPVARYGNVSAPRLDRSNPRRITTNASPLAKKSESHHFWEARLSPQ